MDIDFTIDFTIENAFFIFITDDLIIIEELVDRFCLFVRRALPHFL